MPLKVGCQQVKRVVPEYQFFRSLQTINDKEDETYHIKLAALTQVSMA